MPPTLPDQDISALDWGLGVQTTASGGLTPQLLFTHQNEYFFTVTRQSAEALNNYYVINNRDRTSSLLAAVVRSSEEGQCRDDLPADMERQFMDC